MKASSTASHLSSSINNSKQHSGITAVKTQIAIMTTQKKKLIPKGACIIQQIPKYQYLSYLMNLPDFYRYILPVKYSFCQFVVKVQKNEKGQPSIYHLYYDTQYQYLMSAKKMKNNIGCNYSICTQKNPSKEDSYIAKLRGNFRNNQFNLYDSGNNPEKGILPFRSQLTFIKFTQKSMWKDDPNNVLMVVPKPILSQKLKSSENQIKSNNILNRIDLNQNLQTSNAFLSQKRDEKQQQKQQSKNGCNVSTNNIKTNTNKTQIRKYKSNEGKSYSPKKYQPKVYRPTNNKVNTLESLAEKNSNQIQVIKNRKPQYNQKKKQYQLNFKGLIQEPSSLNYILHTSPGMTCLITGKRTENTYSIYMGFPLTVLQGFGFFLANLQNKLS